MKHPLMKSMLNIVTLNGLVQLNNVHHNLQS